jgi:DNA helicase-2/ATP-dependent DNA helicase PcrA
MLELSKGDQVVHTAFGEGLVLSIMKMNGDALVEIAFDQVGTKRLMLKTASAHMKKK